MATNPITKIIAWLRAGYPEGIPQSDYVALFGILHRSLTPEEVDEVVTKLREGEGGLDGTIPEAEIRQVIEETVHETPHPDDVDRVMQRIDAARAQLRAGQALGR